jgi:quinol monooxygenase YgiN
MITMFVTHKVTDYAAWRKGYDAFEASRKKLGAQGHEVFRDLDDPNKVTAWHDFETVEAAKAFASSEDLKTAMKGAGVVGAPTIWFARRA